jgi:hypothetical protein
MERVLTGYLPPKCYEIKDFGDWDFREEQVKDVGLLDIARGGNVVYLRSVAFNLLE